MEDLEAACVNSAMFHKRTATYTLESEVPLGYVSNILLCIILERMSCSLLTAISGQKTSY